MKKLYFLASLVLAGCNAPETATLVVKTEPNTEVIYWGAGKDEMYSFKLGTKDTTNAEGFITYQVELNEPKTLAVNAMRQASVVHLTPGSRDTLTITKDTIMFAGNNSVYNQCLREVNKYQRYCDEILYSRHELHSVKTPDELKQKYSVHYDKAASIIQNSGLPSSFVEEQMAHLDYTSRLIVAYITMYSVEEKTDEWKAAFKEIADMDWNDDAMRSYRGVSIMSGQLPAMKFLILENGDPTDIEEPYRFMFDRCKDWFEGKALERRANETIVRFGLERRHGKALVLTFACQYFTRQLKILRNLACYKR